MVRKRSYKYDSDEESDSSFEGALLEEPQPQRKKYSLRQRKPQHFTTADFQYDDEDDVEVQTRQSDDEDFDAKEVCDDNAGPTHLECEVLTYENYEDDCQDSNGLIDFEDVIRADILVNKSRIDYDNIIEKTEIKVKSPRKRGRKPKDARMDNESVCKDESGMSETDCNVGIQNEFDEANETNKSNEHVCNDVSDQNMCSDASDQNMCNDASDQNICNDASELNQAEKLDDEKVDKLDDEVEKLEDGKAEKSDGDVEQLENEAENLVNEEEAEKLEDGEAEKLEDGEAEKLEDGEAEKLEDGEADKLEDGEEAEKLEAREAEKLEDGEAEKLEDGEEVEKLDNGESEQLDDVEPAYATKQLLLQENQNNDTSIISTETSQIIEIEDE